MDFWRGGGGVVPVTFLVENFDSLMKIFNILKSSILSVQKTSSFHKCIYILSTYMLIIRSWLCPKCTFTLSYTTLNLKDCKINNATGASVKSKKVCDISKGGGGCLQKNVHMTFLVDKINL